MNPSKAYLAIFMALALITEQVATKRGRGLLSKRDLFEISVLDPNNRKDKKKILKIVFGNKNEANINKQKILVLAYKLLINKTYKEVKAIYKKQENGKFMTEEEEDVLVNAHIVKEYLLNYFHGHVMKYSQKQIQDILDKKKFETFMYENHNAILKKINDQIFNNPNVLDAGIHFDEKKFNIDL